MSGNPMKFPESARKWRAEYLESVGAAGGTSREFTEYVRLHYLTELQLFGSSMEDAALSTAWRSSRDDMYRDDEGRQLTLAGMACPKYLTICGAPGDYSEAKSRRVAYDYANVAHAREHVEFRAVKVREANRKHERELEWLAEVERRNPGGDDTLLVTLLDA